MDHGRLGRNGLSRWGGGVQVGELVCTVPLHEAMQLDPNVWRNERWLTNILASHSFRFYPEHELTYALLMDQPSENLKWSMCCPAVMAPAEKDIVALASPRGNKLKASADIPPEWQHSMFRGIPFVGPVWNTFSNLLRYTIKLEDCADFIAADLEAGDDKFVGKRVGLIEVVKGKED